MNLRENLENNFRKYTSKYDLANSKIKLKVDHTYRVAHICEEIAKSLFLSDEDIILAWVCGMLHDIGRFEQVKRYGTFIDANSIDHAQLGADLLFNEGLLEEILGHFVVDVDCELLEKAIRTHNVYRLPKDMTDREKMISNILRDADKVDILRVNYETPIEEIYNVTKEELRNAQVSEDVKKAFDEHRCVSRQERKSVVDHIVGHICLTFELKYPKSKEIMLEQGYLFKILEFESCNEVTREWFKYMLEEMKKLGLK